MVTAETVKAYKAPSQIFHHQRTISEYFCRPDILPAAQPTATRHKMNLSFFLRFNGHFPDEPGLAGVY